MNIISAISIPILLYIPIITVFADPWLPEKGRYKFCGSAYIASNAKYESLSEESKQYYYLEKFIVQLYDVRSNYQKDNNLTEQAKAHRIQDIDQIIASSKAEQRKLIKYYPKRIFSQRIEYGITERNSLGLNLIEGPEKTYIGRKRHFTGVQILHKTSLYRTQKRILSVQPSITIYQREHDKEGEFYAELRFLSGKVTKSKLGKTFHNIEISPAWSKDSLSFNLDYTVGLEGNSNIIFMLQSFNSFEPRATIVYKQRVINQISVAKPLLLDSICSNTKLTLQVGYFNEQSISARRSINEGMLVSLWLEI